MGDINLPSIDWNTYTVRPRPQYGKPVNETMLSVVNDYFLDQLVMEPTRENNILDLLLTNAPDSICNVSVIPGMSDHEAVTCECNINIKINKKKPRTIYIHSKADSEGLRDDLTAFSTEFCDTWRSQSASSNWSCFKQQIQIIMDKNVPSKRLKGGCDLPG